jgi:transketolase
MLLRDKLINIVYENAKNNKNIYFFSADLGAKALDKFRENLKEQFIHTGISEQSMINIATAFALEKKNVFTYAMIPFLTARAFEQIKFAAILKAPINLIGVGSGFSYDDAGPTHYGIEDIGYMQSIPNINIYSPSSINAVKKATNIALKNTQLNYIRLDRKELPEIYNSSENITDINKILDGNEKCIVSNGYMLHKVYNFAKKNNIALIDIFKIKPLNIELLYELIKNYKSIYIVEEHFISCGIGSIIINKLNEAGKNLNIKKIGIKERFYLENGGREYLHKLGGIDLNSIKRIVLEN